MALATGSDSARYVLVPKEARRGLEVRWFNDLISGSGAASGLGLRLREALVMATTDAAVEAGERTAAARSAAEAAERERVDREERDRKRAEQQHRTAEEAEALRRASGLRVKAAGRYRLILILAFGLCVTVLVPWLIGLNTRDALFRPLNPLVFDTDVRENGTYFGSDWTAGCAWIALAVGVALLARSVLDWRRYGLNAGHILMSVGVIAVGAILVGQSAERWELAESKSRSTLDYSAVPSEKMACPGTGLNQNPYNPNISGGEVRGFANRSWSLRLLSQPDETGTAELGLCIYAGWNYVDTVSLGPIAEATTLKGSLYVLEEDGVAMVALDTRSEARDEGVVYGSRLGSTGGERVGPLPWYAADRLPDDGAGGDAYVTRGTAWSVVIPQRSGYWSFVADGPHLVIGPWINGAVGDLLAIGADGAATVVAPSVTQVAWTVVDGSLYLFTGASPTARGSSFVRIGPDLAVMWESTCPDGLKANGDSDGIRCGFSNDYSLNYGTGVWTPRT